MADNLPETVELPAPTAWPIVFAFGVTLLFAGLVTSVAIGVAGALAMFVSAVGWFRDVLPVEAHEHVPVTERTLPPIVTTRAGIARERLDPSTQRARLPVEIYPVSAGVKGGLAGSVVMALLAMLYGIVSRHGIWYPINLLVAGFFPNIVSTMDDLSAFHLNRILLASAVHLLASLLVGLLYGAVLPMVPRRPILLAAVVAPMIWSGLLYSSLDIINPVLNARIDWMWFLLSQVGFGLTAGIVVNRQARVHT